MNKLFVGYKPPYMSSTKFLFGIKKKYQNTNCGFSGTLDPFAKGSMIIAFGQYAKLFRFFKKTKKTYKATVWLGVTSDSLDIENITSVSLVNPLDEANIKDNLQKLVGKLEYIPPKFSAKWIDGRRAYDLARAGRDFEIPKSTMEIFEINFISYRHPFITFEATVSEGSYIRSLAQILLENLGCIGTLSYLERTCEGDFTYDNEKPLNPIDFLDLPQNFYLGNVAKFADGKKMSSNEFEIKDDGIYYVLYENQCAIMQLADGKAKYLLNKIHLHAN